MCIPTHPIKKTMASLPLACTAPAAAVAADAVSASPAAVSTSPSIRNSAALSSSILPKRLRRVRFQDAVSSCDSSLTASPPSPLNGLADWSGVWYAASDLVGFRDEARTHCRALRQSLVLAAAIINGSEDEYSSDSSSVSSSSDSSGSVVASEPLALSSEDEDDESRGLEARCCLERQRRKYLTNRCIVRAQKQLSGDQLAMLAQRCTSWAATLAVQEGARDYHRAYKKQKGCAGAKRSASLTVSADEEGGAEGRRVRPRTVLQV